MDAELLAMAIQQERERAWAATPHAHVRLRPHPSWRERGLALLAGCGVIRPPAGWLRPVPMSRRPYARLTA